ncbi:MAG: hypothetical protein JWM95_3175 [Gemmatimonadetes bacterium]|nr:hypothetical protein [Gemmatimonadota bacterium]
MTARIFFLVALVMPCGLVAQGNVPVINLPAAMATSVETVGAVLGLRQIEAGKLLVNDGGRRQIRLFDASLGMSTIVLDSTPGLSNSYGPRPTPLVPYLGDSSLFADRKSKTVLVFDAKGRVARSMAAPAGQDVSWIAGPSSNVDTKGRLIFLGTARGMPYKKGTGTGFPDSVPLLRVDFDTRRIDTVGMINRPLARATAPTRAPNGVTFTMFGIDPLRTVDEWSVLSDGSLAFVRGQDYHIDWVRPDGAKVSSPKMPFDWKRLTDEEKQKLADSARVAQNEALANDKFESEVTMMTRGDLTAPPEGGGKSGRGGSSGGGGGEDANVRALSENGRGYQPRTAEVIPLSEISDYYPPIRLGAAMPDLDGHVWILPTTSAQSQHGELVYDVVNASGELFQRVRLPLGRSIIGFARGGIVYMAAGDRKNGFHIERSALATK